VVTVNYFLFWFRVRLFLFLFLLNCRTDHNYMEVCGEICVKVHLDEQYFFLNGEQDEYVCAGVGVYVGGWGG